MCEGVSEKRQGRQDMWVWMFGCGCGCRCGCGWLKNDPLNFASPMTADNCPNHSSDPMNDRPTTPSCTAMGIQGRKRSLGRLMAKASHIHPVSWPQAWAWASSLPRWRLGLSPIMNINISMSARRLPVWTVPDAWNEEKISHPYFFFLSSQLDNDSPRQLGTRILLHGNHACHWKFLDSDPPLPRRPDLVMSGQTLQQAHFQPTFL